MKEAFDSPEVRAHMDGIFALLGPGEISIIYGKDQDEHRAELMAALLDRHGVDSIVSGFKVGSVVEEFAGAGTRPVIITGYASYLRSAPQFLVEDLDPLSQRTSRWVEERMLREPAALRDGAEDCDPNAAPTGQEEAVGRAVKEAIDEGALRSSRAVDMGGMTATDFFANRDHVSSMIGEIKSFDPTAGFVEDVATMAKEKGIFATVSVSIDGRPDSPVADRPDEA